MLRDDERVSERDLPHLSLLYRCCCSCAAVAERLMMRLCIITLDMYAGVKGKMAMKM